MERIGGFLHFRRRGRRWRVEALRVKLGSAG